MLSGGERRRLSLAVVVASGANLLVLDEPTNHLDLESREALEAALEAFPGAIRGTHTTVRSSTRSPSEPWRSRSGRYWPTTAAGVDLVRAREEENAPTEIVAPRPKEPSPTKPAARKKGPSELEQVERRITTLEQLVGRLEQQLAEDWTNTETLSEYRTARDVVEELLTRWEALFESA